MDPQKDRVRDKRLRKAYGWTLEQVNELDKAQESKCGICGRLAKEMPLNVDHFHFKVSAYRATLKEPKAGLAENDTQSRYYVTGWIAVASLPHRTMFWRWAITKSKAVELAKNDALPYSVRGLLCPGRHRGCNRLLGRVDSIEWLRKAIAYLENPPAWKVLREKEIAEKAKRGT